MSDQGKEQGIVKPYLHFVDTNVLFKKPVSCLLAIVSLLIPVYFIFQIIQTGVFKSEDTKLIVASILVFLVIAFAGVFGAIIWWHRRISHDEGSTWYPNFRRFIQTWGEWLGTFIAIVTFGSVLILMLFFENQSYLIAGLIPLPLPTLQLTYALMGPVVGFLIIIATKIFLFLLDPLIWLIKQLWGFLVRIVKYLYRFVLNVFGVVEKNSPVWFGVNWVIAIAVIVAGIVFCFKAMGLAAGFCLALGLAYIAFLVHKKKQFDN